MLAYSERLVVIDVDAGNGYVSLVGIDQQGAAKDVLTARELFANETKIGGYRGHLEVVLIEDEAALYDAARANAALVGPDRIRACAVKSDFFASARGQLSQFPHSKCGLSDLLMHRAQDADADHLRSRSLLHDPAIDAAAASKKPAVLLVLNRPSPAALTTLKALLRDDVVAAVAADLTGGSLAGDAQNDKDSWSPFVSLLDGAGFTTHALSRTGADRLRDPEPPEGSMIDVPLNGTLLSAAWATATTFVSARKPTVHLDAVCKGKTRYFAVIGTDSKPIYSFGSVVSVIFWREVLGWNTIVFVLPDLNEVIFKALESAGARVRNSLVRKRAHATLTPILVQVIRMRADIAVKHPERPWISQAVRMTAAMLPDMQPCDYIMTSDSDIGPLNVPYFVDPLTDPAFDIHVHNGFHWQTKGQQQYPMCFPGMLVLQGLFAFAAVSLMLVSHAVGMTVSVWRFLLAPFGIPTSTPDNIVDAFAAELNQGDWYLDQHVLYRM